jgi:hypothetical protein
MFVQHNLYPRYLLILTVFLLMVGCQGNDPSNPEQVSQLNTPIPDMTGESGDTRAAMYAPENPYHTDHLRRILEREDISKIISVYEARGYILAPDQSFLIEGENKISHGRIQIIVMKPTNKDHDEAVMITCIQVDDDMRVFPATFTQSQPAMNSGFEHIFDEMWMKPLMPDELNDSSSSKQDQGPYSVNNPGGVMLRPGQGFWSAYFNCLVRTVPGDVAGCLISCVILPVTFPVCIAACASAVSLADLINCAIFAYQTSNAEIQEQPQ